MKDILYYFFQCYYWPFLLLVFALPDEICIFRYCLTPSLIRISVRAFAFVQPPPLFPTLATRPGSLDWPVHIRDGQPSLAGFRSSNYYQRLSWCTPLFIMPYLGSWPLLIPQWMALRIRPRFFFYKGREVGVVDLLCCIPTLIRENEVRKHCMPCSSIFEIYCIFVVYP